MDGQKSVVILFMVRMQNGLKLEMDGVVQDHGGKLVAIWDVVVPNAQLVLLIVVPKENVVMMVLAVLVFLVWSMVHVV